MKFIMVALISFTLGVVGAGFVALKFFAYGGQSVAAAEIQMSTTTLQLIESNKIDLAVKKLCSVLPIALKNKTEMDASFFATEFNYGQTGSGEHIESQAEKLLQPERICQAVN
ncbi:MULTISPECIES: hypothetical protein [unclassified Shewanella]|jgi:hypothetical protein|uniref:hypothetical protein n=1 Tax=unclassified Shewanella TaxID=196818 RepID=UPI0033306B3B